MNLSRSDGRHFAHQPKVVACRDSRVGNKDMEKGIDFRAYLGAKLA